LTNTNKWIRLTPENRWYHRNAMYPDAPEHGKTACGQSTTTPVYANELRGLEVNEHAYQCIGCLFPEAVRRDVHV